MTDEVTNERWNQHSAVLTLKGELAAAQARVEAAEKERDKLRETLKAASHALRSYQYGNSSTELAQSIADACDAALEGKPQ